MIPGAPSLWVIGILALALPATYGITKLNAQREAKAAYEQGVVAGKGQASTATVVAATETAKAEREAEAEIPITADREAVVALCKRSASCRERGTLK